MARARVTTHGVPSASQDALTTTPGRGTFTKWLGGSSACDECDHPRAPTRSQWTSNTTPMRLCTVATFWHPVAGPQVRDEGGRSQTCPYLAPAIPKSACETKNKLAKGKRSMDICFVSISTVNWTCCLQTSSDPGLWPQTRPHAARMPGLHGGKEPLLASHQLALHTAC